MPNHESSAMRDVMQIASTFKPDAEALKKYHADQRARRMAAIQKMLADGGFPLLHRTRVLNTNSSGWTRSLDALVHTVQKTSAIVALIGRRGTGKTQMAVSAARHISATCEENYSARYIRAMEFFMVVKDSYAASTSERNAFDTFTRPDLLVLDEAQMRNGTPWEYAALTYLIDSRYGAMKSTVLISNELPEAFALSMGDSVMDRLTETGTIIQCAWDSFRTQKETA